MERTLITIEALLKQRGIKLGDLALELGVSISLLSKIKNRRECITNETQQKFQEKYPNYELVNGMVKWKMLYGEVVRKNFALQDIISDQIKEIEKLQSKLEKIQKYVNDVLEDKDVETKDKQIIVYRGKKKERKALYKGCKVALMINLETKERWINPTQEQVDEQLEDYQVFMQAGGKECCTISLRKGVMINEI